MGKSYSYSIVVEKDDRLLINDQEIPLPADVTENGTDPLGWALDQVRETYRGYFDQEPSSELNLTVRDHRSGGPVRRAKFTNPEGGIDLDSFRGSRHARRKSPAPTFDTGSPTQATTSPDPKNDSPTTAHEEPFEAGSPQQADEPTADWHGKVSSNGSTPDSRQAEHDASPGLTAIATKPTPQKQKPPMNHEERKATERGWIKLDRSKSTRPQIGSAENEGRSKRAGLLDEAKKQKVLLIAGGILVVLLLIVGFRIFNGGAEYEALCIDQRTMTRAVSGVACENQADTNHRWWYIPADAERLPEPGDSIDPNAGTFDTPSGSKDVVNKHIERD